MNLRKVVCSLNLWRNEKWWTELRMTLQRFLEYSPDVPAFQELRPETRHDIDEMLTWYQCVDNEDRAWSNEGNLYWKSETATTIIEFS